MNAPAVPSRWFAFRLSTLVLAVWTVAMGGLIAFRQEPWVPAVHIAEEICALSEDHRYLVTRSYDRTAASLWDLSSGTATMFYQNTVSPIYNADISSAQQRVLTLDKKFLRIWDLTTLKQLDERELAPMPTAMFFLAGDAFLVTASGWEVWKFGETSRDKKVVYRAARGITTSQCSTLVTADGDTRVFNALTNEVIELPGEVLSSISKDKCVIIRRQECEAWVYDLSAQRSVVQLAEAQVSLKPWRQFWFDGNYVRGDVAGQPVNWWDARTGAKVASPQTHDRENSCADGRLCKQDGIYAPEGELLFKFPPAFTAYFTPRDGDGVGAILHRDALNDRSALELWRRRHPEWWWGHFYRPEVWAGIALGCVWLLKLWRRVFRKAVPA